MVTLQSQPPVVDDRYELFDLVGKGGMGAVYRARHRDMDRVLAVKVIHPGMANEAAIRRFRREMRTASAIRHANVIQVHDFGETDDGSFFLAMEFVEGETLWKRLQAQGRLPVPEAIGIIVQVLGALGAAHAAGIVHRDLKPDNIMLTSGNGRVDEVRVLDFGIARFFEGGKHTQSMRVTRAGMFIGTAHYASPEQASGEELDGRSDLYAVGCLLYRMLCGKLPFDAPGQPLQILRMHMERAPTPPSAVEESLPWWIDRVVLRLLEKDPNRRYSTADEVISALEAGLAGRALQEPDPTLLAANARRWSPIAAPVALLAAVIAALITGIFGLLLGAYLIS